MPNLTTDEAAATPPDLSLRLDGKVALVTAGGFRMGRAAALMLAARGAHVITCDTTAESVAETVAMIEAAGGSAEAHQADLSRPEDIERFTATVLDTHGVLDVLLSHAGTTGPAQFSYEYESWQAAMNLTLWSAMALTKEFLPLLRASQAGSIIYTSSTAGLRAPAAMPVYAALKGGLNHYVKSIAQLLGPEGIRANAICPGVTDSAELRRDLPAETIARMEDGIPMRRLGVPDDFASLVLFLASDASRFITGQAIAIDGGVTA